MYALWQICRGFTFDNFAIPKHCKDVTSGGIGLNAHTSTSWFSFPSCSMTWLYKRYTLLFYSQIWNKHSSQQSWERLSVLQQMYWNFSLFHSLPSSLSLSLHYILRCCYLPLDINSFSVNPPHGSVTANYYIKLYTAAICTWALLPQIRHASRWNLWHDSVLYFTAPRPV